MYILIILHLINMAFYMEFKSEISKSAIYMQN